MKEDNKWFGKEFGFVPRVSTTLSFSELLASIGTSDESQIVDKEAEKN